MFPERAHQVRPLQEKICPCLEPSLQIDELVALKLGSHKGDSRSSLCREGEGIDLSVNHKPERKEEERRIKNVQGVFIWIRSMGV